MLTQIIHWMQVAGTAFDVALLARVLLLRLHRTYLFITLACVVAVLFDGADLWLGFGSDASARLFFYSRFLCVIVFPLAVWDVFEEIKTRVAQIRRFAIARLISGMLFTVLLAFVTSAFYEVDTVVTMGLVLWAGAATASLAFLITMHRVIRAQALELPRNTSVWMRFYEFSLAGELLGCFAFVLLQLVKSETVRGSVELALTLYGMAITAWCVWKLRRIPSEDIGQAGERAAL